MKRMCVGSHGSMRTGCHFPHYQGSDGSANLNVRGELGSHSLHSAHDKVYYTHSQFDGAKSNANRTESRHLSAVAQALPFAGRCPKNGIRWRKATIFRRSRLPIPHTSTRWQWVFRHCHQRAESKSMFASAPIRKIDSQNIKCEEKGKINRCRWRAKSCMTHRRWLTLGARGRKK